ncbi:hypothetical protein ACWCOV_24370 [Kribbella sp. NPDC002412]
MDDDNVVGFPGDQGSGFRVVRRPGSAPPYDVAVVVLRYAGIAGQ